MNIRVTIFAVLVLVQFLVPGWMIYQQSSTRSGYFKASLNAQVILPTGKLA